jgi:hypothetical protein
MRPYRTCVVRRSFGIALQDRGAFGVAHEDANSSFRPKTNTEEEGEAETTEAEKP